MAFWFRWIDIGQSPVHFGADSERAKIMLKKLLLALVVVSAVAATAETASARRWAYYGRPSYGPRAAYYGYYARPIPRPVYRSYYRRAPVYYGAVPYAYPRRFVPASSYYYYPGFGPNYYYY